MLLPARSKPGMQVPTLSAPCFQLATNHARMLKRRGATGHMCVLTCCACSTTARKDCKCCMTALPQATYRHAHLPVAVGRRLSAAHILSAQQAPACLVGWPRLSIAYLCYTVG